MTKPWHYILYRIIVDIVTLRARVHVWPWDFWIIFALRTSRAFPRWSLFRNKRDRDGRQCVIGWRWGFRILGIEYGCRDGAWPIDYVRNALPQR